MRSKKTKSKVTTTHSSAVATIDPLQRYMKQIGQHELLTPEQEHDLAVRYATTQDAKAAYELTVRNLRLVVKIAFEYRRAWSNVLDLIQEGNIGLMTAIQHFDPYRQTRLTTYAAWWIRAYILKFIMSNWRLIKIGNTQAERKLFYNLQKEHERLIAEGFIPGPKLLAERLNVKEADVIEMSKRLGTSEVSLDLPPRSSSDGEGRPLSDTLSSSEDALDTALATEQIREMLHKATAEFRQTLAPRDAMLLDRRILAEEPTTLQEIGDELKISRERVRQLEERLLKKLKDFVSAKYPDLQVEAMSR